jgi:hypothetical protein
MTKHKERKTWQTWDLMCNTDYTTSEGEILYSFTQKNANDTNK